ncbi:hypothetical protein [Micromonospora sp. KC213]|uniref:hypothetical protein n=1 Tax=Micromonospora sp. KC213 TaxID=2530378 RepID=UPI001042E443|nr:hypothetical protein [Micromonospora sp. KC213]TDC43849.1 hypothetical protein E1166_02345 [Micromonospora sp. KC213]
MPVEQVVAKLFAGLARDEREPHVDLTQAVHQARGQSPTPPCAVNAATGGWRTNTGRRLT